MEIPPLDGRTDKEFGKFSVCNHHSDWALKVIQVMLVKLVFFYVINKKLHLGNSACIKTFVNNMAYSVIKSDSRLDSLYSLSSRTFKDCAVTQDASLLYIILLYIYSVYP